MITLSNYHGRTIAVFGLGKAGDATVRALIAGGVNVTAWDDNEASREKLRQSVQSDQLTLSPPESWDWIATSFLVLSPGIPLTFPVPHKVVLLANETGCLVLGDNELLFNNRPEVPYIGITGTNGKSTTTSLIGHVLKSTGKNAQIGGNLGTSALSLEPVGNDGVYVLELSSYQLDLLHTMHFKIALLLNVTPDHIDRHGTMGGYVASKMKIFDRQVTTDIAVIAVDDDYTQQAYKSLLAQQFRRVVPVSAKQVLNQGVYVDNGILYNCLNPSAPITMDLRAITSLTGRHNWQNAAAAYAVLKLYGLSHEEIAQGIRTFPGLAHRMQEVATIDGVRFINDSKATNADASSNALAAYDTIYWIAGGKQKEGGITGLAKFFPRIAHAFLIGEAENEFANTLEGKVPYMHSGTLQQAVRDAATQAFRERRPNAVVLLSPACASFDQWANFEQRGDAFCEYVNNREWTQAHL